LSDVLAELGQEVEGVATAREVYQRARARGIDMPITEQVYRVLYEGLAPQAAVEALLKRESKAE
ncbi:MAG: glycerol-3-phosphate dehydrogenase, partial [Pseudomonadota bacterium]